VHLGYQQRLAVHRDDLDLGHQLRGDGVHHEVGQSVFLDHGIGDTDNAAVVIHADHH
jgi:hypothetical protein